MGNNEFIKRAKTIITEYFNSNVDGTDGILLGPVSYTHLTLPTKLEV